MMRLRLLFLAPMLLVMTACASDAPRGLSPIAKKSERSSEWRPVNALLMRYDANKDGNVSRAEMDAGLKADFAADDLNHDGGLDATEVEGINHSRWDTDASATSPLIDWNNNGVVDFREYSATIHSLFEDMDKDDDGLLTADEMKTGGPKKPGGETKRKRRRQE